MSKTTNLEINQGTKKDWLIYCKECDWHITYLNSNHWKVERQMEMIAAMPTVGPHTHKLTIAELHKGGPNPIREILS